MNELPPEMADLLESACLGELSAADAERMESLIQEDDHLCRHYILFMQMHALAERVYDAGAEHQPDIIANQLLPQPDSLTDAPATLFPNVVPSSVLPGVSRYFYEGMPLAYLLAAIIVGLGLLIASWIPVHSFTSSQYASNNYEPRVLPQQSPMKDVARITGLVDCRWERKGGVASGQWRVASEELGTRDSGLGARKSEIPKSRNPEIPKSLVCLGDQFIVSSGLMEITYNTGARVILQGPCTYEVDSAAGGFLAIGKLTARVESGGEGREAGGDGMQNEKCKLQNAKSQSPNLQISKSPNSNPQSLIPNPCFTVCTPTATITDLGTEFGVEVKKDGKYEVHVLEGLVQVNSKMSEIHGPHNMLLRAGEGLRCQPKDGLPVVIPADRSQFKSLCLSDIRNQLQSWLAYSREMRKDSSLLAYYTFESVGEQSWTLPNMAATGNALDGEIQGPLWTTGRFPGKLALHFHGPASGDKVVLPDQDRFNFTGPFSVVVWFNVERFSTKHEPLIAKGDCTWRFQQDIDGNTLAFDTSLKSDDAPAIPNSLSGRTKVADGQWHLAVAVYEPINGIAHKRLYIDGHLDAEGNAPLPLNHAGEPVWIGSNSMAPERGFQGMIDEAAIYTRALSAEEVAAMFKAGSPYTPRTMKGGS